MMEPTLSTRGPQRAALSALLMLLVGTAGLFVGCTGDSGDTLIRNVGLTVAGFYTPVEGATTLTQKNTGNPVTSLNVTQAGDQLDAVDNNGLIFRGTLGQVTDDTASFTLEGLTTAGQAVTIAGTFSVPVGSSSGTMQGTWIEPSVFSAFAGQATVPVNNPDSGDGGSGGDTNVTETLTVTASPTSIDISGTSLTSTVTASGGSGSYTFSVSDATLGSIPATGNPATYTATADLPGTQTITVDDGSSTSQVIISQTDGS